MNEVLALAVGKVYSVIFYNLPGFLSIPLVDLSGVESLDFPFVNLRLLDGVLGEFAALQLLGLLVLFDPGDLEK